MANDHKERVKLAKQALKDPQVHDKGCSELVSHCLGVPFEQAKSLMGDKPEKVGTTAEEYAKSLKPGDVAGWNDHNPEHVAIYIGEKDQLFIDVKEPKQKPRPVKSGYGKVVVYKSSKY